MKMHKMAHLKIYELCENSQIKPVQLKNMNLNNLITSRQNPIGNESGERYLEHKHQLSQCKAKPGRTKESQDEKLSKKL